MGKKTQKQKKKTNMRLKEQRAIQQLGQNSEKTKVGGERKGGFQKNLVIRNGNAKQDKQPARQSKRQYSGTGQSKDLGERTWGGEGGNARPRMKGRGVQGKGGAIFRQNTGALFGGGRKKNTDHAGKNKKKRERYEYKWQKTAKKLK